MVDDETITAPGLFTKRWTPSNATLSALSLSLPGRVVVALDRNLTATTVVATSSSRAVLDLVTTSLVVGSDKSASSLDEDLDLTDTSVELVLRLATSDVDATGTLLITILLPNPVAEISTLAETILQDGALPLYDQTSTVRITSHSNDNVWILNQDAVTVRSLSLTVGGAGNVYLTSSSAIQVQNNLKLTVFAAGSLGLHAPRIQANTIKSEVSGRGSVVVEAQVDAAHLTSHLLGRGSVNYYPSGSCGDSQIEILGSGNAYVASVLCSSTDVNTLGTGDAVVQTIDLLTRSGFGSGTIAYYNTTPARLPEDPQGGAPFAIYRQPRVAYTQNNTHEQLFLPPVPSILEGAYVHVRLSTASIFWPPLYHSSLAARQTSPEALGMFGLVVVVVVASIALVVRKAKRSRGYQLLK
ncbi:hypothetical protein AC1031_013028 [Aphanomyces cochlioides]|nr:hypothetical protein AC1031_013028 [Aphanomyces cochlioides]